MRKIVALILLIIILSYGCESRMDLKGILKERAIVGVDLEQWSKIKIGMDKDEVVELLGYSESQLRSTKIEDSDDYEFWQYGWTNPAFVPVPSAKAYVIYFNKNGKVTSFREPLNKDR